MPRWACLGKHSLHGLPFSWNFDVDRQTEIQNDMNDLLKRHEMPLTQLQDGTPTFICTIPGDEHHTASRGRSKGKQHMAKFPSQKRQLLVFARFLALMRMESRLNSSYQPQAWTWFQTIPNLLWSISSYLPAFAVSLGAPGLQRKLRTAGPARRSMMIDVPSLHPPQDMSKAKNLPK